LTIFVQRGNRCDFGQKIKILTKTMLNRKNISNKLAFGFLILTLFFAGLSFSANASAKNLDFGENLLLPVRNISEKINSFFKNFFAGDSKNRENLALPGNQASPLPVPERVLDYEEQIVKVVEKSAPSAVSIVVSKDLPVLEQYFTNPFEDFGIELPQGFGVPQYRQKGTEKREIGGGTGFVVSANGLIVTNKHVVSDAQADYTVILNDGKKLTAKVIVRDPSFDLAVLKVERNDLVPLPLGDSSKLKLGKTVIAIGNALGEFKNTVSVGVVSGLNRSVEVDNELMTDLIQSDAAINKGNSGGPLLNLSGEVVGINTAMALGAENIGFAIPINQLKKTIEQVEKNGSLKLAYLGVKYQLVTPDLQKSKKLSVDYGALIVSGENDPGVVPNSPAENAGLKEGDIILEINGEKVARDKSLASILRNYSPEDRVSVKIIRDGREMTLQATLGER